MDNYEDTWQHELDEYMNSDSDDYYDDDLSWRGDLDISYNPEAEY